MEELRRQVIDLQCALKDHMDKPRDPAARRLMTEVQALEDELQVKKSARSIEKRVERIIDLFKGDAKKARIMNYEHLELFCRKFERLRDALRKIK